MDSTKMSVFAWVGAILWIGAMGSAPPAATAAPPLVLRGADTMEKVFRDEPWQRPVVEGLSIAAAKNEVEGIQLVLAPGGSEDVAVRRVDLSALTSAAGATIDPAQVSWRRVGYVETEKPPYPTPKVGWWPDPLLPPGPFRVEAGRVQPLWIEVRVPPDAAAGLYRGTVTVQLDDRRQQSAGLEVRVWDFTVPKQQHLETCLLLRTGDLQKFYELPKVPIEMYQAWIDFCLDHRIGVTLCDWPEYRRDMERLAGRQLERGGSAFCLGNAWFQQGDAESRQRHNREMVRQLKELYDRAKARGWIDRAYVYCHDEIGKEQYPFARELYGELKKAMPDLRLMQTFYQDDPIPALGEVLDIWAPNTGRYRPAEFQAQQAQGDDVWWYVCCGPGRPYANLMIEWPAVDHRLLLWQNWKYGVTGFLYWGTAVWRDNAEGEGRWPERKWDPATWRNAAGQPHNGDGQLLYPGPQRTPLASLRLANLRDGIEDYEYFWLLRQATRRLKAAGAAEHQPLVAEAEAALAVDPAVVADLTHFTEDPQAVRQARAKLADLIERTQAALK